MNSRTHNIFLFYLLLAPTYFIILLLAFVMLNQIGSIIWMPVAAAIAVNLIGSWLLSNKRSLVLNTLGFLCFLIPGAALTLVLQQQSKPRYGYYIYEVYAGIILILMGAAAYLYQIIYRIKSKKNN